MCREGSGEDGNIVRSEQRGKQCMVIRMAGCGMCEGYVLRQEAQKRPIAPWASAAKLGVRQRTDKTDHMCERQTTS